MAREKAAYYAHPEEIVAQLEERLKILQKKIKALEEENFQLRQRAESLQVGLKCSKNKPNYLKLNKYLANKTFDENYALLSHYIQLQSYTESEKYKNILFENGIDVEHLPNKNDFNSENNVPFPAKENTIFTFIDLFAGIGGFRLAMQDIGGKCVFSSEWDDAAKQTYFENFGEVPFGDITKPETKALIPEKFDVLCAGFPCQAFSIAGYQKGFEDVRGTLFFDVADILEKYRPKAFFLENVKNLKSHDGGKTFAKIMDVLQNRLGYKVDSKIMNPCEYANVPQNRERIFIVGFDPEQVNIPANFIKDEKFIFPFPQKKKLTKTIHDVIDENASDEKLFYREGYLYYDRMKGVITNPNTVYQWRRVYIRENKNNLCPTLTANMGEGGHNVPIICTPKGIRKFTPEECLGFQGFPTKKYRFPETIAQSKKYKQAGNSVTEPLIELVADKILKFTEEKEKAAYYAHPEEIVAQLEERLKVLQKKIKALEEENFQLRQRAESLQVDLERLENK